MNSLDPEVVVSACMLRTRLVRKLMFPLVKKIIDGVPLVLIMIDCAVTGTRHLNYIESAREHPTVSNGGAELGTREENTAATCTTQDGYQKSTPRAINSRDTSSQANLDYN